MSAEISLLIPEFRKKFSETIAACKEQRVNMQVLCTVTSPLKQAGLWKQGRTKIDAELKTMALEQAGAPYLAECMREARPTSTGIVTDSLPGNCWYQWGEEASVVWVDGTGRLNWSSTKINAGMNGYHVFAEAAIKFGLTSGSSFGTTHNDWALVQLRPQKTPHLVYSLKEIDAEMKKRFGSGK